jgi:hypothetical protein
MITCEGSLLSRQTYPVFEFLLFAVSSAALFVLVYHDGGLAFLERIGGVPMRFVSVTNLIHADQSAPQPV